MSCKCLSRGARVAPLCLLGVFAAALSASAAGRVPRHLIDGSVPPAVPQVLRVQSNAFVMTKVRVVKAREIPRLMRACVFRERLPHGDLVVERIGVNGRDITFPELNSTIFGCDRNPRASRPGELWCGKAGWSWHGGPVRDPRIDLCTDRHGQVIVAFGWIDALPHAKWIVIYQPGFREVYPVAGGMPVRVSTVSGIASSTTFHTAQYDARGVLLARRVVRASVGG